MAHQPQFEITISRSDDFLCNFPHPPLKEYLKSLGSYHWQVHDPHQHRGGFGLSSALTLAFAAVKSKDDMISIAMKTNQTLSPKASGADILSQYFGGFGIINTKQRSFNTLAIPDLNFIIVRTGLKAPTHLHLNTLASIDTKKLSAITNTVIAQNNTSTWIQAINEYESELQKMNLRIPEVINMIQQLKNIPEVVAVKGCGALGADVILLACYHEATETLIEKLDKSFEIIATNEDIVYGS